MLVQSVEHSLFDFHHKTPGAFWASFSLNLASQCMAVSEVCLILWLMGVKMGFFSALVIEALTKLVNVLGNFNPGNIGTYEAGTMLIGKMFGLSSATGLALGLSRRLRSLFWAAVGAICFVLLTRSGKHRRSKILGSTTAAVATSPGAQANSSSNRSPKDEIVFAIFLADGEPGNRQFSSSLYRVGTLPILLRTILAAQKAGATCLMVVADPITRRKVQRALFFTGRLPESVEWIEAAAGISLSQRLLLIANKAPGERLVLIDGNKTYHPSLLRKAAEWNDGRSALALVSGDQLAGIFALPIEMLRDFAERCPTQTGTLNELRTSLTEMHSVVSMTVAEEQWQRVNTPQDCQAAERKLDRWLVKPTDGLYARLNRRISIPISRQLIKLPITANMVSIFTLGSRHCFCRILRLRRLLEHIARRAFMPLRQHSGWVRWRGRSFETTGIRFRLLAGDNLRLRVLPVSSCGHDHRTVAKLGNKNVPGIWRPALFWSLSKLPRHRMGAAPPCRWASRAATENLAGPRGEPAIESFLVFRPTYGVHRPALFFPLCPARLCAL